MMTDLFRRIRFKLAYWRWFYEPFPAADRKQKRTLPKDPVLRRQTLRLMHERWKAREPQWETFEP